MFEVFKITHNTYDETVSPRLPFYARAIPEAIITNSLIIPYYLSKIFFYTRIVNVWNSLSNSVVDASTINAFKARLDKLWLHQAVYDDFTADLTGTGNRSEEVTK